MRTPKPGFRWSLLLVLATNSLPVLHAVGAEKPVEQTLGPFAGTVVDPTDKPVAGAQVWLLGYRIQTSRRYHTRQHWHRCGDSLRRTGQVSYPRNARG